MSNAITRKAPKQGRFPQDVYGRIEQNHLTGEVRIKWFWWDRIWNEEEKKYGDYEWCEYRGIFSHRVGGEDKGPYMYPIHYFRNMKRATRHYHRVMLTADRIAARKAACERSERDDWKVI